MSTRDASQKQRKRVLKSKAARNEKQVQSNLSAASLPPLPENPVARNLARLHRAARSLSALLNMEASQATTNNLAVHLLYEYTRAAVESYAPDFFANDGTWQAQSKLAFLDGTAFLVGRFAVGTMYRVLNATVNLTNMTFQQLSDQVRAIPNHLVSTVADTTKSLLLALQQYAQFTHRSLGHLANSPTYTEAAKRIAAEVQQGLAGPARRVLNALKSVGLAVIDSPLIGSIVTNRLAGISSGLLLPWLQAVTESLISAATAPISNTLFMGLIKSVTSLVTYTSWIFVGGGVGQLAKKFLTEGILKSAIPATYYAAYRDSMLSSTFDKTLFNRIIRNGRYKNLRLDKDQAFSIWTRAKYAVANLQRGASVTTSIASRLTQRPPVLCNIQVLVMETEGANLASTGSNRNGLFSFASAAGASLARAIGDYATPEDSNIMVDAAIGASQVYAYDNLLSLWYDKARSDVYTRYTLASPEQRLNMVKQSVYSLDLWDSSIGGTSEEVQALVDYGFVRPLQTRPSFEGILQQVTESLVDAQLRRIKNINAEGSFVVDEEKMSSEVPSVQALFLQQLCDSSVFLDAVANLFNTARFTTGDRKSFASAQTPHYFVQIIGFGGSDATYNTEKMSTRFADWLLGGTAVMGQTQTRHVPDDSLSPTYKSSLLANTAANKSKVGCYVTQQYNIMSTVGQVISATADTFATCIKASKSLTTSSAFSRPVPIHAQLVPTVAGSIFAPSDKSQFRQITRRVERGVVQNWKTRIDFGFAIEVELYCRSVTQSETSADLLEHLSNKTILEAQDQFEVTSRRNNSVVLTENADEKLSSVSLAISQLLQAQQRIDPTNVSNIKSFGDAALLIMKRDYYSRIGIDETTLDKGFAALTSDANELDSSYRTFKSLILRQQELLAMPGSVNDDSLDVLVVKAQLYENSVIIYDVSYVTLAQLVHDLVNLVLNAPIEAFDNTRIHYIRLGGILESEQVTDVAVASHLNALNRLQQLVVSAAHNIAVLEKATFDTDDATAAMYDELEKVFLVLPIPFLETGGRYRMFDEDERTEEEAISKSKRSRDVALIMFVYVYYISIIVALDNDISTDLIVPSLIPFDSDWARPEAAAIIRGLNNKARQTVWSSAKLNVSVADVSLEWLAFHAQKYTLPSNERASNFWFPPALTDGEMDLLLASQHSLDANADRLIQPPPTTSILANAFEWKTSQMLWSAAAPSSTDLINLASDFNKFNKGNTLVALGQFTESLMLPKLASASLDIGVTDPLASGGLSDGFARGQFDVLWSNALSGDGQVSLTDASKNGALSTHQIALIVAALVQNKQWLDRYANQVVRGDFEAILQDATRQTSLACTMVAVPAVPIEAEGYPTKWPNAQETEYAIKNIFGAVDDVDYGWLTNDLAVATYLDKPLVAADNFVVQLVDSPLDPLLIVQSALGMSVDARSARQQFADLKTRFTNLRLREHTTLYENAIKFMLRLAACDKVLPQGIIDQTLYALDVNIMCTLDLRNSQFLPTSAILDAIRMASVYTGLQESTSKMGNFSLQVGLGANLWGLGRHLGYKFNLELANNAVTLFSSNVLAPASAKYLPKLELNFFGYNRILKNAISSFVQRIAILKLANIIPRFAQALFAWIREAWSWLTGGKEQDPTVGSQKVREDGKSNTLVLDDISWQRLVPTYGHVSIREYVGTVHLQKMTSLATLLSKPRDPNQPLEGIPKSERPSFRPAEQLAITPEQHVDHLRDAIIKASPEKLSRWQAKGMTLPSLYAELGVVPNLIQAYEQTKATRIEKDGQDMSLIDLVRMLKDSAAGLAYIDQMGFFHGQVGTESLYFGRDGKGYVGDYGGIRKHVIDPSMTNPLAGQSSPDVIQFGIMLKDLISRHPVYGATGADGPEGLSSNLNLGPYDFFSPATVGTQYDDGLLQSSTAFDALLMQLSPNTVNLDVWNPADTQEKDGISHRPFDVAKNRMPLTPSAAQTILMTLNDIADRATQDSSCTSLALFLNFVELVSYTDLVLEQDMLRRLPNSPNRSSLLKRLANPNDWAFTLNNALNHLRGGPVEQLVDPNVFVLPMLIGLEFVNNVLSAPLITVPIFNTVAPWIAFVASPDNILNFAINLGQLVTTTIAGWLKPLLPIPTPIPVEPNYIGVASKAFSDAWTWVQHAGNVPVQAEPSYWQHIAAEAQNKYRVAYYRTYGQPDAAPIAFVDRPLSVQVNDIVYNEFVQFAGTSVSGFVAALAVGEASTFALPRLVQSMGASSMSFMSQKLLGAAMVGASMAVQSLVNTRPETSSGLVAATAATTFAVVLGKAGMEGLGATVLAPTRLIDEVGIATVPKGFAPALQSGFSKM